jgi:hypothetical protein
VGVVKSILVGAGVLASAVALGFSGVAGAAPGGNGNGTVHLACSALIGSASGGNVVLHVKSGLVTVSCRNANGAPFTGVVQCEAFAEQAEDLGFEITGGAVRAEPSGNVNGKCTVVPLEN